MNKTVPASNTDPAESAEVAAFNQNVSDGHMVDETKDKAGFDTAFSEFAAAREAKRAGVEAAAPPEVVAPQSADSPATPVAAAPPATVAATPAAPAAKVRPAWFDSLPPEAKAEYERLEVERQKDSEKLARMGSQVNAYERKLQEARKATPAPAKAAGVASDEAQKFAELYPEINKGVEARMAEIRELVEGVKAAIDPLAKDRETRIAETNEAAVEAAHQGWKQTVNSDDFKEWFSKQPESIRNLGASNAPEDAVAVLDFFTSATGFKPAVASSTPAAPAAARAAAPQAASTLAAKRQQQLQDAQGVPNSRPSTETTASAPSDFAAAFEYYRAKRERKEAMTA